MEKFGAGYPHTQQHCLKPQGEKAFNAVPLMALFSSTAFLALSVGLMGWPTSKDSIIACWIDWSLQFYLLSLRAFDGQHELCQRVPFLGEKGRGARLQTIVSHREMKNLSPAWRRHHGWVGKESPPDAARQLRSVLQP